MEGGGLVLKAHRLLYHSNLGLRVIEKKKKLVEGGAGAPDVAAEHGGLWHFLTI